MIPSVVYSESLCKYHSNDNFGNHFFRKEVVKHIRDGDIIADIGCGKSPYSSLEIHELLTQKGIEAKVVGIDPSLEFVDEEPNLEFKKQTYQQFFGIGGNSHSIDELVKTCVSKGVRVIGARVCSHQRKKIPVILKMLRNYSVQTFEEGIYFVAVKKEMINGMPKDYYEFLEMRGHFD